MDFKNFIVLETLYMNRDELTIIPKKYSVYRRNPSRPGGHLNKKDGLTRYGNSHVKDKTS